MSYINTIETAYECGPLGEVDFIIEFEYHPEDDILAESCDICEVRVKVYGKGATFVALEDWSFTQEQENDIRIRASEQYRRSRAVAPSDDDRIDAEYEAWKERQLYREVE